MMTIQDALEVVAAHRGDRIVISTMSSVGVWSKLSDTPLDCAYIPSAMGQAVPLALGVAMGKHGRGVIVLNGDGSTLMNLGCLVTLASHPAPVFVIIMDNGLYEVTGGQPTAGAGRVDFAGLGRAAGIPHTWSFDSISAWRDGAAKALAGPGPAVIALKIEGRLGQKTPAPPRPMADQIARLRQALGVQ